MKKSPYYDCPKDYRRNYKKEFIEKIKVALIAGSFSIGLVLLMCALS